MVLADRMGALVSQLAGGRTHSIGIRHYGPLVSAQAGLLASSVVAGVLRPMLSSTVTVVNARTVAESRGIEIVESKSSRPRDFANLLSIKLQTSEGERWIEGTVFEPGSPRLVDARRGRRRGAPRGRRPGAAQRRSVRASSAGVGTILGPTRHQHRQLCARAERDRRGRCRRARLGRRRASPAGRSAGDPRSAGRQGRADWPRSRLAADEIGALSEPTSGVADFARVTLPGCRPGGAVVPCRRSSDDSHPRNGVRRSRSRAGGLAGGCHRAVRRIRPGAAFARTRPTVTDTGAGRRSPGAVVAAARAAAAAAPDRASRPGIRSRSLRGPSGRRMHRRARRPESGRPSLPTPAEPPLQLVGVAERETPAGTVRTAMITADSDELFMLIDGDTFGGRYRVKTCRPRRRRAHRSRHRATRRLALR